MELEKSITLEKSGGSEIRGAVLMLHHFGGKRQTMRRHRELYLSWGYDVISCDLPFHGKEFVCLPLQLREQYVERLGAMREWALKHQRGKRIGVHAFSSTSSAAFSWLARAKTEDWFDFLICENGPFLDFSEVRRRTVRFFLKPKLDVAERFLGWCAQVFWDPTFNEKFPKEIELVVEKAKIKPIKTLVLMCDLDELIPPAQTKPLLEKLKFAKTHLFKQEHHLTALKNQPKEYNEVLMEFLGQ